MSAELVIIIVGAVLLIIAIGDSIKIRGSSLGLIHIRVKLLLGMIGVLGIIYGGYSFGLVNPQTQIEQANVGNIKVVDGPVDRVELISPLEGDSVLCRTLAMGVYPDNHDKDIWVLLKPSDEKYYPQSDHTNTSYKRNGEWQVITRFGGDRGERFEIIVYETDSIASLFFSSTIQSWKDALSYPGLELEELPSGAVEVDKIVVTLKDECRGVF
jgi:hypothetical protein